MRTIPEDVDSQGRGNVEGRKRREGTIVQQEHLEMLERKTEQKKLFMGPAGLLPGGTVQERGLVRQWVEVFDYRGDANFSGFVAEDKHGDKALMVFFGQDIASKELKHGYFFSIQ